MTTSDNISAIEDIEKALEGVKHSKWFMSPWHVEEDASAVRNQSDGSYICNASSDSFAAYIAACNPVAMSAILAEGRKAEALKREIAELHHILAMVRACYFIGRPDCANEFVRSTWELVHTADDALRARTLLNGGSDAQE